MVQRQMVLQMPVTWYYDADGDAYGSDADAKVQCDAPDGYVNNMMDCDDTNDASYPEAPELCDNVDNDCDEEIDEEAQIRQPTTQMVMVIPMEMRTQQWMLVPLRKIMLKNSDDCDDSNEHAWSTDAAEVCDTFDNNCDGTGENGANVADEGVTTTYYADVDQDSLKS